MNGNVSPDIRWNLMSSLSSPKAPVLEFSPLSLITPDARLHKRRHRRDIHLVKLSHYAVGVRSCVWIDWSSFTNWSKIRMKVSRRPKGPTEVIFLFLPSLMLSDDAQILRDVAELRGGPSTTAQLNDYILTTDTSSAPIASPLLSKTRQHRNHLGKNLRFSSSIFLFVTVYQTLSNRRCFPRWSHLSFFNSPL